WHHTSVSCNIGTGCPSFGGQRTVCAVRKALRSRVFSRSLAREAKLEYRTHSLVSLVAIAVFHSIGLSRQHRQLLGRGRWCASAHECNAGFRCSPRSCSSWPLA